MKYVWSSSCRGCQNEDTLQNHYTMHFVNAICSAYVFLVIRFFFCPSKQVACKFFTDIVYTKGERLYEIETGANMKLCKAVYDIGAKFSIHGVLYFCSG